MAIENPHLARSLLADVGKLPVRKIDFESALIVAPHPDDESLGCGGLIALMRRAGKRVDVVFVSDGGASHPESAENIPKIRRTEALAALAHLDVPADRAHFLNLPDSHVPHPHDDRFEPAAQRIANLLENIQPQTLFTPWRRDKHHDHIATTALVNRALELADLDARLIEYPIWVWEATSHEQAPTSGEMRGWRLDVSAVLAQKRAAIYAHRSQTSDLIADDPNGFVLSEGQIGRFLTPHELYFEPAQPAQDATLSPAYFEGMYAEKDDPWEFASSAYEAAKYADSLATLPHERYANAYEVGCSIGVFTRQLAGRVDRLLAVDAAANALGQARERCADLPHVRFAEQHVPEQWADGQFDLIVVSEVAYYLGDADLARLHERIVGSLAPNGQLLLVHWTPFVADYPQTGDGVHDFFLARDGLRHLTGTRRETYRVDLFEKA